jgi:hypothetical protein
LAGKGLSDCTDILEEEWRLESKTERAREEKE